MIFRTLVVLQAAYVALATETSSWSYLEWENHDGVQVSSESDSKFNEIMKLYNS